jgi:hypothetical protein
MDGARLFRSIVIGFAIVIMADAAGIEGLSWWAFILSANAAVAALRWEADQ